MNKAARTALARETINGIVPSILSSNPRAQKGVQSSRLFRGSADLPKLNGALSSAHEVEGNLVAPADSSVLLVHLVQSDTLDAAQKLHVQHPGAKIAVLNMASPLQPGGGVLRGAKAQEESLCMRSTLYPSLRPEWYRHPIDAVIYTPDVLVFRSSATPEMKMLEDKDRFYLDVISCAAPRHPEIVEVSNANTAEKEIRYADPKDEEMMTLKVKFIMRTAVKMGITHLVLGALGCGAYRNPIGQVANIMRKCVVGKGNGRPPEEDWKGLGIEQVLFAILDDSPRKLVWRTFVEEFEDYAHMSAE
jgi:uncharacterized protein (TIGR02452 family)